MQQNKTNSYIYYFAYLLLYLLAINVDSLTPDYLIQTVDEIQSGYGDFLTRADWVSRTRLWSQITPNFIIPQISQLVLKGDRKAPAARPAREPLQGSECVLRGSRRRYQHWRDGDLS
jgi:exportin-2 (importin alpha re-exporter)